MSLTKQPMARILISIAKRNKNVECECKHVLERCHAHPDARVKTKRNCNLSHVKDGTKAPLCRTTEPNNKKKANSGHGTKKTE